MRLKFVTTPKELLIVKQLTLQVCYQGSYLFVGLNLGGDYAGGVDYAGVISSSKVVAYLWVGGRCVLTT